MSRESRNIVSDINRDVESWDDGITRMMKEIINPMLRVDLEVFVADALYEITREDATLLIEYINNPVDINLVPDEIKSILKLIYNPGELNSFASMVHQDAHNPLDEEEYGIDLSYFHIRLYIASLINEGLKNAGIGDITIDMDKDTCVLMLNDNGFYDQTSLTSLIYTLPPVPEMTPEEIAAVPDNINHPAAQHNWVHAPMAPARVVIPHAHAPVIHAAVEPAQGYLGQLDIMVITGLLEDMGVAINPAIADDAMALYNLLGDA